MFSTIECKTGGGGSTAARSGRQRAGATRGSAIGRNFRPTAPANPRITGRAPRSTSRPRG